MHKLLLFITFIITIPLQAVTIEGMSKYEKKMMRKELHYKIRELSQQIDKITLKKEQLRRMRDEATEQLHQIRNVKAL